MIVIEQNTTNNLTLPLKEYFEASILNNIVAAEITFGQGKEQIRKLWYAFDPIKSNASYIKSNNTIKLTLTPEDSLKWKYQIPIQIRIKTKDGFTPSSKIFYGYIQTVLSGEDF